MKTERSEFIHVASAFYAAEVRSSAQIPADQIQAERAGLQNLTVGMALRADGYRDHRRYGVDHACPRDGDQVIALKARLRAPAGKHNRGNGGKKRGGADGAEGFGQGEGLLWACGLCL